MKKEYNVITCEGCGKVFKLRVSKKSYGQIIEVVCWSCGLSFKTIAYHKSKLDKLIIALDAAVTNAVANDPAVTSAIADLFDGGFSAELTISGSVHPVVQIPKVPFHNEIPFGNKSPDVFSEKDIEWMANLKVNLLAKDDREK